MAENPKPPLDAPIPGQSLTAELGNRPWQNPPQFTTVQQAVEFYIPRLVDPNFVEELISIIELGIPLKTIANSMMLGATLQGRHTIDIGVLIMPVLIEMMAYLAESANVEYELGTEEDEESNRPSPTIVASALNKIKALTGDAEDMPTEEDDDVDEEVNSEAPKRVKSIPYKILSPEEVEKHKHVITHHVGKIVKHNGEVSSSDVEDLSSSDEEN